MFHMTGTLDDSPVGKSTVADRRVPFDHIAAKEQFLVTFTGGDHMVFSGRVRAERRPASGDARRLTATRRRMPAFRRSSASRRRRSGRPISMATRLRRHG